ncbi:hypothetical protein ABZV34_15370 [Streptomyces sp. NPDC005195]|uniref:hypothetical protein n=1 Tax=Streptomyces sp. NPDC005195 TaxID=3154561 RepID=UPI0033ADC319
MNSAHRYPRDLLDVRGVINLDFDEEGRRTCLEVLAAGSRLPKYPLQSAQRPDTEGA